MSLFREIPPTAGFPVHWRDLFSFSKYPGSLEEDFRNYLGVGYAAITYSGTAAFYFLLESLKKISRRKTVIIPAFICPLLPLAIARAGLKVEVCDILPGSFNFDLAQLGKLCAAEDVLAIVAAHLGGLPLEIHALKNIAEKHGIFLIEDCAQSLGAEYDGRKLGAWGDFAFFSLCRGKGLTIYEGGVAVARKEMHAKIISQTIKEIAGSNYFSEGLKIMEFFGYALLYRPAGFWFIFRLPQIFWQMQGNKLRAMIEEFDEDFGTYRVSRLRKRFGHLGFFRLEQEIKKQREKADYYFEGLKGQKTVTAIKESALARATYPYVTLLFADPDNRNRFLASQEGKGLGISIIYTLPISDYPYLKGILPQREFPAARSFCARHFTLSTSVFLKRRDQDRLRELIRCPP